MAQKNRDYWEERQVKREAKAFTTIQDIEKEYKIALEKAKQNINKELSRIGTTYMKDNNLSYHDALKLLKGDEYKVWKKDLHDYLKEYNKLLKTAPLEAKKLYLEIETLSARSRLSYLDSLKAQVDMEMVKLIFGVEDSAKNALTSVYRDTFIEVTKDLGINAIVSRDKIKAVLDRPWSGANFSERLWTNTDKLAQTVKQEIVNGMIQGINLKTMSKRVSERFETAKKNDVERLLRTEVNYVLNQATLDGYKEAGIEKYEFSATLDSRTSQICSELHGEVFEIKKIAVGLNYPPMHPRCRSTTIPVIDYESLVKQGRDEIGEKDDIDNNAKVVLTDNENSNVVESKDNFDDIINCKNSDELNKVALSKLEEFGYWYADFSGIDLEVAKENLIQLINLNKEYKSSCNAFTTIDINMNAKAYVVRKPGEKNSEMFFIKREFQSKEQILKDARKNLKFGIGKNFSVIVDSGKEVIATMTHEFGHTLTSSRVIEDSKELKAFWKEIKAIHKEYKAEYSSLTFTNEKDYDVYMKKKEELFISEYAKTNIDEFFAECFCMGKLSSTPSPYAKRVLDVADKYFKK